MNQENHKLDEKRQLTANTKMNQILELSDKNFKAASPKNVLIGNHKFSWDKNQKTSAKKYVLKNGNYKTEKCND